MCLAQGDNAVTPVRLEKTLSCPTKLGHKQHIDLYTQQKKLRKLCLRCCDKASKTFKDI